MDINKVNVSGTVEKGFNLKVAKNGTLYCNFTIACIEKTERNSKANKVTSWHNITAWGPIAEYFKNNVNAGAKVFIEGRNVTRKYQNDSNNKIYRHYVDANFITLEKEEMSTQTVNNCIKELTQSFGMPS